MVLEIVDGKTYQKIIGDYKYFYNSMAFHELNRKKADEVLFFLFKGKHYKMGIAGGVINQELQFPYSAPFAMPEIIRESRLGEMEEAIQLLDTYAQTNKMASVTFRLPPFFYDESNISKMQTVLLNEEYQIQECDLNFQFYMNNQVQYIDILQRNAKKNLQRAQGADFDFVKCIGEIEKKRAYQVIQKNRCRKGYPLRMSWEQVQETIRITEHDIFLLNKKGKDVAAIVFCVNKDVYQVIYWGDIDGYSEERPMNLLAENVYEFYQQKGIHVLDIGPSTENGVPNYGLCDFKESIGCQCSSKYTLKKFFQ